MVDTRVDHELLKRFEAGFDPRRPERGAIPARVLAYGKGCTILTIQEPTLSGLVFKRMAIFQSSEEAERYETLLRRYVRALGERAGVRVAPCTTAHLLCPNRKRWAVYIIQERLADQAVGHHAIDYLLPSDMNRLVIAALQEAAKVFDFNQAHLGELELGLDGRISNWAIIGFDPEQPALTDRTRLYYLDIGTPLMRRRGAEQFDPAPLLRSVPTFALPVARRTFLPNMLVRYYDFRRVTLDLLSSILKEGYGDFMQMLADTVNWFFLADRQDAHFRPITVPEVTAYHRRDSLVWWAYLVLRKRTGPAFPKSYDEQKRRQ